MFGQWLLGCLGTKRFGRVYIWHHFSRAHGGSFIHHSSCHQNTWCFTLAFGGGGSVAFLKREKIIRDFPEKVSLK